MNSNFRKQEVTQPDNWLHNNAPDYTRSFGKFAYLPQGADDLPECTNAEKEQWEKAHPQPTPPSPIEERVVELIRQRYSINQELEARRLMDKVLAGTATDDERKFAEDFDAYVKECQEKANEEEAI